MRSERLVAVVRLHLDGGPRRELTAAELDARALAVARGWLVRVEDGHRVTAVGRRAIDTWQGLD